VAWLVGSAPLAPPPPALYVDVVNPIVATSERHEARRRQRVAFAAAEARLGARPRQRRRPRRGAAMPRRAGDRAARIILGDAEGATRVRQRRA
jgi:hypothetical protein